MVGEVGFAIPSILKTKGCTLFSILSFRRNRSFRKGLTHELTRLDISFLESNFPQHVYTRTLVDNRNHLAKGEGVMLYVVVRLCATFPCFHKGAFHFLGNSADAEDADIFFVFPVVFLFVFFLVWLLSKQEIGNYRPIRRV
jgi:hypothetical protein